MPLRINNNIPDLNALRIMDITGRDLNKRIERLSSNLKVNGAADDCHRTECLEGEQTAETALNEINGMLLRMRKFSVHFPSSTVNDGTPLHFVIGIKMRTVQETAYAVSNESTGKPQI